MRRLPTFSLRRLLLIWLLIPILVLWLIGAGITYGLAMSFATDAYDESLLDSAHFIATRAVNKKGHLQVDLPADALDLLKDNLEEHMYFQVLSGKGAVIAGDTKVPATMFGARQETDPEEPDFHYATVNGEKVRVVHLFYTVPGAKDAIQIQIAQTLHSRHRLASDILTQVVIPQLVMVMLSALVVLLGVRRGLKPLNDLRDEVSRRTPSDLRPIRADRIPKEVRPLVQAINGLMERLQRDMEGQQRFVANAAHQLRTPIAGLKTQTELAQRLSDPAEIKHALSLIKLGAERATKLTHQLLTLAKSEPSVVNVEKFQIVDLNGIVRNAVKELASLAQHQSIDLGFEGTQSAVFVKGDPISLHELASNLIENAIRYTQAEGHVNVSITHQLIAVWDTSGKARPPLERACLKVEDDGPGIPENEREHVFERFYRLMGPEGSTNPGGSGLGLSIVQEIARAHRATVSLGDGANGRGTSCTVMFEVIAVPGDANKPRTDMAHSPVTTRTAS